MCLAFEARGPAWPGIGSAPPFPARERYGHDWGIVYLKTEDEPLGTGPEPVEVRDGGIGEPAVSWADGVIHLHDRRLIDADTLGAGLGFLRRAFLLEEVRSVEFDWAAGKASVHYEPRRLDAVGVLERLAAATRDEPVPGELPEVELPAPPPGVSRPVKWFRHGRRLSTWEVLSEAPGRIRFRHPLLGLDRELSHRVEAELGTVHGVNHVHARPLTASLLVQFDPAVLSKRQLVHILDELVRGPVASLAEEVHPPAVAFGLATGSVGLAAVGELAVPALLPASAVLLVVSNARVIREAGRELARGQLGLPLLYTAIVAGTLGTGQFLGAALMSWMYKYWRHRHRLDQSRLRRQLLPSFTQRRRFARLRVGGEEVEVPTDRLQGGDRIVVDEGEMVPADGRLLNGPVVVDERLVGGVIGLTRKRPGDPILAGSRPVQGALELEVSRHGHATRAARLGRELAAAAVPMPTAMSVTARGEAYARRAVVPTLAAAGVGLMIGDLITASAILRPDYATGPGLGTSMELLRDIAACARDGVVIRDPSAFDRLASADVWIFDHHPALERVGLEVDRIQSDDEDHLLRLAATAFRDLADDRAIALRSACAVRGLSLLAIEPDYRGPGVTLQVGTSCVTVDDARDRGPEPSAPPLVLTADGRALGRISFRPSIHPAAFEAIRGLRASGPLAIGLVSDRPDDAAGALSATLGLDFHHGGLSSTEKVDLIRSCRERGLKVAYVGDGRLEPEATREAHVAISLADEIDPECDPSPILALRSDLSAIATLRERARAHVTRVRTVHRAILIPNLLCVAGAFLLGFTSLSAVVITNLGTWAVYAGLPHRRARSDRRSAPELRG
jgi:P-type E1-E2 ATPase